MNRVCAMCFDAVAEPRSRHCDDCCLAWGRQSEPGLLYASAHLLLAAAERGEFEVGDVDAALAELSEGSAR
jgi:hypothetical protein